MARVTTAWSDAHIEVMSSVILRVGLVIATGLVLAGGLHYLSTQGTTAPQYHVFHGEPPSYCQVRLIFREALRLQDRAVIQVGLFLLVLTPVVNVALTLVAFIRQRDRTFVAISLIVLGILLFNLIH